MRAPPDRAEGSSLARGAHIAPNRWAGKGGARISGGRKKRLKCWQNYTSVAAARLSAPSARNHRPNMTAQPSLAFSREAGTIPVLGFGTGAMTGGMSAEAVAAALGTGYRHIDTARKYGTEPAVGEAMRASGLARNDIFLTTKVSHENLRAEDFARSVDESLAALKVDYVDLLLVHWPNPSIALAETMPALAKAKRQGLARHIGIANFNIALLDQAVALCPEPLVALQAEYHPYLDQSKLIAAVRRHQACLHRLLSAGARTAVRRSGARRHRREARPQRRAGRAALAAAAGRRRHSVFVEAGADRRQFRRVRFHAR